jgi:AGCS family alanine or glycine:cation symporter
MYYIEKGLGSNWTWMAVLSAGLLGITSFLTGNANQANSITDTLEGYSGLVGLEPFTMSVIVAALVAGLVALVIIGGVTRIGRVTSIIAPVMAAIYVLGGLTILAFNIGEVPGAFGSIVTDAFNPSSGVAGTGAGIFMLTMIYGVQRGLFSNEAGMGSAPIAHSAAKTDEPVSEGVVALLEPFIDTIIICSITGLVIVVTGVWDDPVPRQLDLDGGAHSYRVENEGGIIADETPPTEIRIVNGEAQVADGTPEFAWNQAVVDSFFVDCVGDCETASDLRQPFTGTLNTEQNVAIGEDGTEYESLYGPAVESGAPLTQLAFARGLSPLGDWGGLIVVFSVLLFAISTSISWSYYGDRCAIYLFGEEAVLPYKVAFVTINFLGGIAPLATVWAIGDIALGLVIIPNLVAVVLLSDKLTEITDSYFEREAWLDNVEPARRAKEKTRAEKEGQQRES